MPTGSLIVARGLVGSMLRSNALVDFVLHRLPCCGQLSWFDCQWGLCVPDHATASNPSDLASGIAFLPPR